MTDAPKPEAVTFEWFVLEQLAAHADYLFTLESDLRDLLRVEMLPAPRFVPPAQITSVTATAAMRQADEAARRYAAAVLQVNTTGLTIGNAGHAQTPTAGGFREVERDEAGRVVAVIDPSTRTRRAFIRDGEGRVIGFDDTVIGGGA